MTDALTCEVCGESFGDSDACPACGTAVERFACDRHPMAVATGRCVVCSRALCQECRGDAAEERVHLCDEHASVFVIQGWAQVVEETDEIEAHLIRDNLVAEGIDSRVFSQKDRAFSVDLGELSVVRVLVPAWEYERAVQFINDQPGEDAVG
jgi:hypothetical protein